MSKTAGKDLLCAIWVWKEQKDIQAVGTAVNKFLYPHALQAPQAVFAKVHVLPPVAITAAFFRNLILKAQVTIPKPDV